MSEISDKVLNVTVGLLVGGAFLPLLSYWDLITITNPSISALFAAIPILALIGLGIKLYQKRKES